MSFAKFNYDRFHIDKVLGNWKSDNNKNKKKDKKKNKCLETHSGSDIRGLNTCLKLLISLH